MPAVNVKGIVEGHVADTPRAPMAARVNPARVTSFQSGHGFTQGTGTGVNSDDATDFALGSQSRKYVSAGTATFIRDTKTGLSLDLTGKFARVLLKMDKVLATEITGGQLYLSNDSGFTNFYKVELFDLLAGPSRNPHWLPNEWAYITMGLSEFTTTGAPTLTGITTVRLAFQDASTVVTLHANAIDLMPAPSVGVVSIMFDDGWASQYAKAQSYMSTYGYPGTLYMIASRVVTNDALAVTLPQLKSMQNEAGWEIASHAYDQALHDARYVNFTDSQVANDMARLKAWLRDNGFRGGDHFAWPNGEFDSAKLTVARRFFSSARTTRGQSHETIPPADPMRLRYITGIGKTSAQMNAEVDKCVAQKSWLTLAFHDIADAIGGNQAGIQTTTANFNATIDYIATKVAAGTLKVKTVGDVLATGAT